MEDNLEGVDNNYEKRIAKNQSISASFATIGSPGLNRFGGTIQEEFMSALRMPDCLKVFQEMSWNDPIIGSALFTFEELARRCNWPVEPGGKTEADLKAKKFVEECRDDMERPFHTYVTEALSMIVYGFSIHEKIYKLRRGYTRSPRTHSKYNDGKIGWRGFPGRSQASWNDWVYDDSGNLNYFEQLIPSNGNIVQIPMKKCLHFRTRADRDNPEGRSLLRNAYRPWYFKKYIEEIEAIGIERDLAGLPVMKAAEGVDMWNADDPKAVALKSSVEELVANVRRDKNQGLAIPFGWEFDLVSTGGSRQIDTNEVLNRIDQRIAITLLADIVMLGADKVGSFALADVKKSLLASALEALVRIVADVFNSDAIPELLELNNFTGLTAYPRFKPSEIEVPDINNIAEFLVKINKLGINLFPDEKLENYLSESAGLPEGSLSTKIKGTKKPDTSDQRIKVDMETDNEPLTTDDKTKYNQVYEEGGRK